jgi:hypothetical protein
LKDDEIMTARDEDALVARTRAAFDAGQQSVPPEDLSRLLELCEVLALRYASLSRFVAAAPGLLHPGKHSALERDANPASGAFFDTLTRMMGAKQEFARQEGERAHFRCQCCGLPTLTLEPSGGSFESCPVCHWEQERIIDPTADTGGPNGVSLIEARRRFEERGRSTAIDLF